MNALNRQKRLALRDIQEAIEQFSLRQGAHLEHIGVVDIFFHPTNPDPRLNFAIAHKGVAWIPGPNILEALEALGKHHPSGMQVFEGLFPPQFFSKMGELGLVENAWRAPLLTYGTLPDCEQQPIDFGMPHPTSPQIAVFEASDENGIHTWSRLCSDELSDDRSAVNWQNVLAGYERYFVACDDTSLAGRVALSIKPPFAELRGLFTSAHYRRRGIGASLIRAAVNAAHRAGGTLVFVRAESEASAQLYRHNGFVDLDRIAEYRLAPRT